MVSYFNVYSCFDYECFFLTPKHKTPNFTKQVSGKVEYTEQNHER